MTARPSLQKPVPPATDRLAFRRLADPTRRTAWQRLRAFNDRLENSWVGDVIAGVSLLAIWVMAMFFVAVFQ